MPGPVSRWKPHRPPHVSVTPVPCAVTLPSLAPSQCTQSQAYTHRHTWAHANTCTCTHWHTPMHTCTHTGIRPCVHTHVHMCMCRHTYTHAHRYTLHAHAHRHTPQAHTCAQACSHAHVTCAHTQAHSTCAYKCSHAHMCIQVHIQAYARVCMHMCTRAQARSHAHTCTCTRTGTCRVHTHSPTLSLLPRQPPPTSSAASIPVNYSVNPSSVRHAERTGKQPLAAGQHAGDALETLRNKPICIRQSVPVSFRR